MQCPRCTARLVKDFNGDVSCYTCGFQLYTPAELAASQRAIEFDKTHSHRPAMRSGLNLH